MSASIEIKTNEPEISAKLAAIADKAGNVGLVLAEIGAAMVLSTQRRFETTTAPDGTPWRRLAPRTAKARAKRGRSPDNILRDTVRLYQSLTYQVSGAGAVADVAWGTNVKYGAIHQFGGTIQRAARKQTIYQNYDAKHDVFDPKFRPKRASNFARDVAVKAHTITIPARPYLGINDQDREEIEFIVSAALQRAIGGAP